MIYYNDNNIYVGQIKQLLKEFNLPKARVYKEGEKLVQGLHYIKNNGIYYCSDGETLTYLTAYTFGSSYFNITTNFRVLSNVYDSYTHKYLGKYLRFLKDYSDLDLMSMYNCFSNEQLKTTSLVIKDGSDNVINSFDYDDDTYNVYCVPVRFGQKYTIGINTSVPVYVVTCLYKDGRFLNINDDSSLYNNTYSSIRNCSLTKPFIYTNLYDYAATNNEIIMEECLTLLVKVPSTYKSSIVILEGDYSKSTMIDFTDSQKLANRLFEYKVDGTVYGNYDYTSKLELLSYINCENNGLLATRLTEYLSENAITNMSEPYDIKKAQRVLINRKYVYSDYLGIWSEEDRKGLYKFINDFDLNSKYYDVISYVDKDVEYNLGGIE